MQHVLRLHSRRLYVRCKYACRMHVSRKHVSRKHVHHKHVHRKHVHCLTLCGQLKSFNTMTNLSTLIKNTISVITKDIFEKTEGRGFKSSLSDIISDTGTNFCTISDIRFLVFKNPRSAVAGR
jgi:hypothetical protein